MKSKALSIAIAEYLPHGVKILTPNGVGELRSLNAGHITPAGVILIQGSTRVVTFNYMAKSKNTGWMILGHPSDADFDSMRKEDWWTTGCGEWLDEYFDRLPDGPFIFENAPYSLRSHLVSNLIDVNGLIELGYAVDAKDAYNEE